jgi:hypothetical protein
MTTTILDTPFIARTRRNHGLEHATINILSGTFPYRSIAGWSHPGGFFIFGDLPTDNVREAAVQALARMNNGESNLAIHPGCGTNYAVAGFLAGSLVWLGMVGAKSKRQKVERLPLALILATLGLIAGQPLGPVVQERLTTSAEMQGLTIMDIFPIRFGRLSIHQVITRS